MKVRLKRNLIKGLSLALAILPKRLRHRLIRSQLQLAYDLPEDMHFKIAETTHELEGAFALLHDAYVEMGYMEPHPSGMRVTFYHLLPSTTTIVGMYRGEVVSTLSIVRDTSHGLPLESEFSVAHLRAEGATIAEISSLAVRKDFRKTGGMVLFPLFRFLWIYCRHYFGVDYIVMASHPKRSEMFDALILFSPLDDKKVTHYGFANGAPAVSKVLDLRKAPMLYASKYGDNRDEKNLYRYMVPPEMGGVVFEAVRLPDRRDFRISDPIMTPELMKHLFVERARALDGLTEEQKRTLISHYSTKAYLDEIPQVQQLTKDIQLNLRRPADPRIEVRCHGLIAIPFSNDQGYPLTVTDVSNSGLAAKCGFTLEINKVYRVKVAVAPLEVIELTVRLRWQNLRGGLGLEIIRHSSAWSDFIRRIHPNQMDEAA
ncbi:MAG: hypothetical protein KDD43_04955 [Bdellovibrionales bacterium]|nr:hypothetical protein [Bdellovibrionales bacterium]